MRGGGQEVCTAHVQLHHLQSTACSKNLQQKSSDIMHIGEASSVSGKRKPYKATLPQKWHITLLQELQNRVFRLRHTVNHAPELATYVGVAPMQLLGKLFSWKGWPEATASRRYSSVVK